MRAVFKKEYLDELEKKNNSETTQNQNVMHQRKAKKTTHKKVAKKGKVIKRIFIFLLIIILLIGTIGLVFFMPYIKKATEAYEAGLNTTRIDVARVPHIYDKDGKLICVMYGYYDNGEKNFEPTYSSVYTPINEMPDYVSNAFTAIEDETFYGNSGISLNRLLYATFNYIVNGDSSFGGSTITQQLVKVATGEKEHSASRKAQEIGSALYLTDHWSKEKILGGYINLVYYGNGAYGIYEAALTYFNVEPKDLNIAQAALLASLPNAPDGMNPYGGDAKKERLLHRQKLVLKKMLELNLITQEQYDEAKNFNIEFSNGSDKIIKNDPAISQYLKVAFKEVKEIVKKQYNCSDSEAIEIILNGGANITLNLDMDFQRKAVEVVKSNYADYDGLEFGGVITTKAGEVISVITTSHDSQIDHAYGMVRQTGSAIKPITVYGPAFDMGLVTPETQVIDSQVTVTTPDKKVWNVQNAYRYYKGQISIQDAIAYSTNTIAVDTLKDVTITKAFEYAKSFGITSLSDDDLYYPCLALGGFTHGISPFEMTQAYNVFNNDGVFRSISTVKSIKIGEKEFVKDKNEHQVISPQASNMIKQCMEAVGKYGTGKPARLSNVPSYIKTGTSSSNYDIWNCGYTDEITACFWNGYDTNKDVGNYQLVKSTWKDVIELYYE